MTQAHLRHELEEFGEPFAKALAVFVRELGGAGRIVAVEPSEDPAEDDDEFVEVGPAFRMSVGDRIRLAMAARQVSQAALADESGLSPSTINRVLKSPDGAKLSSLRRIAEVLELPLPAMLADA